MKREYTEGELAYVLVKASILGYSLEAGSPLEKLTIAELDELVTCNSRWRCYVCQLERGHIGDHEASQNNEVCAMWRNGQGKEY